MKARDNKEADKFAGFLLDEVAFITMSTNEGTSAVIISTKPRVTNAALPSEADSTELLNEADRTKLPTEAESTELPRETKAEFQIEANRTALLNGANRTAL